MSWLHGTSRCTEETIDRLLASTDPADQAVLRQWSVWHVLPRVRRRIDAGRPSVAVIGRGKSSVRTVHHGARAGWSSR